MSLSILAQASVGHLPERRYADEFDRGVAALRMGMGHDAAEAFRAAGELAPAAPLWRLYVAAAERDEVQSPNLAADPDGPWRLTGLGDAASLARDSGAPVAAWLPQREHTDHEHVEAWGPAAVEWAATRPAEFQLTPALDDVPWLFEGERAFCVLEHARALLFASRCGVVVYDVDSGARLWSRQGAKHSNWSKSFHDAPRKSRITFIDERGSLQVVDARTGRPPAPLDFGVLGIHSIMPVENHLAPLDSIPAAALVATTGGSLRTFALATGRDLGRSELHLGDWVQGMRVGFLGGSALEHSAVTWDDAGRVALWTMPSLVPRAELRLDHETKVEAVSFVTGAVISSRRGATGATVVEIRRIEGGALMGSHETTTRGMIALSDDGERIALVSAEQIVILDTESGVVRRECALGEPPAGRYDHVCAFHGPSRLVLGWGAGASPGEWGAGIDVYDLVSGALVGRHRASGFFAEIATDGVCAIESMPDVGRVAYALFGLGGAVMVEDLSWSEVNLEPLIGAEFCQAPALSRATCSARICLSGRHSHIRADDVESYDERSRGAAMRLFDLAETPSGRYVVGHNGGQVLVFDGETFELLYGRQELNPTMARIWHVDGHIVDPGVAPTRREDGQIARNGTSHPLAGFRAWLDDPLQLAAITLASLPSPPQIVGGPSPSMRAAELLGVEATLSFTAEDAGGLLGAWVLADGGAPRFLPAGAPPEGAPKSMMFEVDLEGEWPLDVELIAVGVTGLESKPWRTRIE